jgi:hypothetical protein
LVVDFVPYLLAAEPRHNLRQWPELINLREAIDLGWSTRHAQFCAELALGMLLRTVKDRDEIRSSIAAALRGESSSYRDEIDAWVGHWKLHQGAMLFKEQPDYRGEVDTSNRGLFPRAWRCHPVNEVYVRRLLDLAATHSIKVFWLLPPATPKFQDHYDEIGLESSHERFLLGLQSRYPDLTIVDGRHSGYGHELFVDPLHLSRRGAVALSADLATILGDGFRGKVAPGWMILHSYHEPRSDNFLKEIAAGRSRTNVLATEEGRHDRGE